MSGYKAELEKCFPTVFTEYPDALNAVASGHVPHAAVRSRVVHERDAVRRFTSNGSFRAVFIDEVGKRFRERVRTIRKELGHQFVQLFRRSTTERVTGRLFPSSQGLGKTGWFGEHAHA
jgi:hypothetical protein